MEATTRKEHVTISLRLPEELDRSFTNFARKNERNKSEQIRYLIRSALAEERQERREVAA